MPTFSSFGAFERELAKLGQDIERAEKGKITKAQAEAMQRASDRVFSGALGGDPKFSHWAPAITTQAKPLRDGATLFAPTKTGAGPATVAVVGRNKGSGGGMAGPGIMRSGRTSKRVKSGGAVKAFKAKRWNGYTDSKVDADAIAAAVQDELTDIAERGLRKAIQRHFDVT